MSKCHILLTVVLVLFLIVNADTERVLTRDKRSFLSGWKQDTNKTGFTAEERGNLLQVHNDLRRNINATNMKLLSWDSGLESVAQAWADECDARDNNETNYGENQATQPAFYNETKAVNNWHAENQFYNYLGNSCTSGQECGHYIQVVLAESSRLGCGIRFCSTVKTLVLTNTYYIVCNYDPGVNNDTGVPYEEGMSCSNCPSDAPICEVLLCRADNSTTASTTSVTDELTTCSACWNSTTETMTTTELKTSTKGVSASSTNSSLEVTTISSTSTSVEAMITSNMNSSLENTTISNTSTSNNTPMITTLSQTTQRNSVSNRRLNRVTHLYLYLFLAGAIFMS